LRAITRALRDRTELFTSVAHHEGRHATADELALAHDPAYLASVERIATSGGGYLDVDTVASQGSWDAARAAAGCLLDAVDFSVAGVHPRSFCAVRPPGHHALRYRAMGFCLFGNIALAALYARARHRLERVLIIDWDVHHGNGTQALVEDEPDIHFVSMHQWPWYPGTGPADDRGPHRSIWNVPLAAGLSPGRYASEMKTAIERATAGFTPELVLISAGFDSLARDPLGGFTFEPEDVADITRWIVERAEAWCGGRVVSALEGGYAPNRVAAGATEHLAALAG
jgi:acetoin utilization deacetylase AcuC-like enzyme